jgi:hypothetical protein
MRIDPENRLLWRMPRRRMEFEPLRDRLLVAAGQLNRKLGGRSVMIHQDAKRRGLYAYMDREDVPGLLASFDVPSPDASQAIRAETTVPQQALYLMNARFVIDQAIALAQRTELEAAEAQEAAAEDASRERVRRMYRLALAREPDDSELQMALDFATIDDVAIDNVATDDVAENDVASEADKKTRTPVKLDRWTQLAQVLLLSNEFAFVD